MALKVNDVAAVLGKDPQLIRVMMQQGLLPFGVAFKKPGSSTYSYVIFPEKFREYCGEIPKSE